MSKRGRPKKYRIVRLDPGTTQFSPRGKPGRPNTVELEMDEFEALRLADFMGIAQKDACASMRVSQQTFSRILRQGRKKLITAIITGSSIHIQGGVYALSTREKPTL
jgi:uncharacterized protein